MDEAAASVIARYIEECLFAPKPSWPEYWFKKRAYSRWAADELMSLVMDNPLTPATELIECFLIKMEYFLCVAEDSKARRIFSAAKETAEEILYLLERGSV